jgi:hypothetical protein
VTTGPVAEVVFQLDGKDVARSSGSPWRGEVDFGAEYTPHELVARALDQKGAEIARARQWINLPRPPAEVEIFTEKDKAGRATAARLAWASRMGPHPTRASLTFDGRELPLDIVHRAKLPVFDVSTTHVLTAQIEFANDVRGRADLVLGGGSSDTAGSELTAVPIRIANGKLPSVESLQGRLVRNGMPLTVTGVERGPATLVLVRNLQTQALAVRLRTIFARKIFGDPTKLEKADQLQVQWPVLREISDVEGSNLLFEASRMYPGSRMSIVSLLTEVGYPGMNVQPRRFADAVAVAGVQAARYFSPRAVVLVLGPSDQDASRGDAAAIRRYLERLHVPLHVWALAEEGLSAPTAAWGSFANVSTAAGFRAASDLVREDLRSQSIAWVEGRYLPQEITLVDRGDGITIAR